jgi:hypothetical protein
MPAYLGGPDLKSRRSGRAGLFGCPPGTARCLRVVAGRAILPRDEWKLRERWLIPKTPARWQ